MEIVSASLNTTFPEVNELVANRDKKALIRMCNQQLEYGATRIGFNCATRLATEVDDMLWITRTLQDEMEVLIMPDSPNFEAIKAVVEANQHGRVLIDSTTCEEKSIANIMPLAAEHNCLTTVLLHDEKGMPKTVEDRLRVMATVERMAKEYNVKKEDLILDSLIFPLSIDEKNGEIYLESLKAIQKQFPGYRYTCGLDNLCFGLPSENYLAISFLMMCMALGQDCVFLLLDAAKGAFLKAADAVMGNDEFTMEYISAYRSGWFPKL